MAKKSEKTPETVEAPEVVEVVEAPATVKGKVLAHFTAVDYTFSPNEIVDFEAETAKVLEEAGLIEIVKEG